MNKVFERGVKMPQNSLTRDLFESLGFMHGPDGLARTVWESRCYRILEVVSPNDQMSRLVFEYTDRDTFGHRQWVNIAWIEGGSSPAAKQYQRVILILLEELVRHGLLSPLFSESAESG